MGSLEFGRELYVPTSASAKGIDTMTDKAIEASCECAARGFPEGFCCGKPGYPRAVKAEASIRWLSDRLAPEPGVYDDGEVYQTGTLDRECEGRE